MGGIGFFIATSVSLAIWGWEFPRVETPYILGAISIMFFVGLRDDIVELSATKKILGQLIAVVLVVVVADIRIKGFHGFLGIGEFNLLVSYLFSSFTLLALTNAFNLIDGLDGLAGTIAAMVFALLGIWFYFQGLNSYAILSIAFLGSILAFLVFNWHPAKIFMGDTGSLTLGFTMGTLIIAFMEYNVALPSGNNWKFEPAFSAGVALMMFPLYDMARVFVRRISQGKGPMTPDKSHVHHFLMRMGLKHNHVALLLGSLQLGIIILVFFMKDFSDNIVLPIIVAISMVLGYRLDQVTVHYLKKKVALQPKVLEVRPVRVKQKSKIKLDKIEFKDSKVNLN
ncbi:MraY family glycosyltransferase [Algoriphagus chordae]|uniref:UDP-N-acetylmuramyl pentapeptide phosphotransferase/UDP-N-acetylglucosamine-1-phosphate transferase n=1 Tax=Algoriphagus chordae TaxID=237019 RepID=A0A2W7R754_9BACT|nr:MraY family glycosyltransferase [Algoriphagus chordae]PZX54190.1 UDP-N-acetylmuramyl pentapeptide phosphotransferase/UDP-N-acetylglucosamine-1-phosphate transferase [Algoriphagus chordae]